MNMYHQIFVNYKVDKKQVDIQKKTFFLTKKQILIKVSKKNKYLLHFAGRVAESTETLWKAQTDIQKHPIRPYGI